MYNPAPPTAAEIAAGYVEQRRLRVPRDQEHRHPDVAVGRAAVQRRDCVHVSRHRVDRARPVSSGRAQSAGLPLPLQYGQPEHHCGRVRGQPGQCRGEDRTGLRRSAASFTCSSYQDGWYGQTDGEGFSLTIRDPLGTLALWDTQRRLAQQRGTRRFARLRRHARDSRLGDHQRGAGPSGRGSRRHDRAAQHDRSGDQRRRVVPQRRDGRPHEVPDRRQHLDPGARLPGAHRERRFRHRVGRSGRRACPSP